MPSKFIFGIASDGNNIEILYDATGQKLRKTVKTLNVVTLTQDYISGIELKNNRLESIYNEEGRAYNTTNATQTYPYTWRGEYNLKDHLGNTRVSFTDKNANGRIDNQTELLQETHYYPFGMAFNGAWYSDATASKNKYLYNGKELNEEFGLNLSDYGARWYDASIGRWWSIDPLAEKARKYNPYTYGNDSPVRFIDPDGRESQAGFGGYTNSAELSMRAAEDQWNKQKAANAVNAIIGGVPSPKAAAAMAAHVYGDKSDNILQDGWTQIQKFENPKNGFKAALYQNGDNYTLATTGTEDIPKDGKEDGLQVVGLSSQYDESISLARELSKKYGSNLSFTGHSLGGGLASLNAYATGSEALTFNAAGLSYLTQLRYGYTSLTYIWNSTKADINAYIFMTDPLNALQTLTIGLKADGNRHYLFPKDKSSVVDGHSINNFLNYYDIKF